MDLSDTFGVIYWGFVVATILFGISVVQGYYFFLGNKDPWKLKAFVVLLLALDLATTALSSETLHFYLLVNFGNPLVLLFMTKLCVAEYVVTAIIILLSQSFYAWRIYVAKRQVWTPLLIFLLAACAFGSAIALTAELFEMDLLVAILSERRVMVSLSVTTSFAAACDIVSTVALCYYLASHRSAIKETNTLLKTLLFFIANRGILVAVAQIGHLVLFVAFPDQAYWMPFHLSLSKLHVNTLLAMLNSRASLRARANARTLEISTSFVMAGAQVETDNSPKSSSPRTPSSKRQSSVRTFELIDLPRDRTRRSVIFSNERGLPPGIEEELHEDADAEVCQIRRPARTLYTGGDEPIIFA